MPTAKEEIDKRLAALETRLGAGGKDTTQQELRALRQQVAGLEQQLKNLPVVTVEEARQLAQADQAEAPQFTCPNCNHLLREDESPCPGCGEEIRWETT